MNVLLQFRHYLDFVTYMVDISIMCHLSLSTRVLQKVAIVANNAFFVTLMKYLPLMMATLSQYPSRNVYEIDP